MIRTELSAEIQILREQHAAECKRLPEINNALTKSLAQVEQVNSLRWADPFPFCLRWAGLSPLTLTLDV